MTPTALKQARRSLGLSLAKAAKLLGYTDRQSVRRLEEPEAATTHRPISRPVDLAMWLLSHPQLPANLRREALAKYLGLESNQIAADPAFAVVRYPPSGDGSKAKRHGIYDTIDEARADALALCGKRPQRTTMPSDLAGLEDYLADDGARISISRLHPSRYMVR